MTEPRIIKKYPNRRLYDLLTSSYVTLGDVRKFIVDGITVQVLDARTEEDITQLILMQILTSAENSGEALFSAEILQQLIRLYYDTTPTVFRSFFETSIQMFLNSMKQSHSSNDWVTLWPTLSADWFKEMQNFFKK